MTVWNQAQSYWASSEMYQAPAKHSRSVSSYYIRIKVRNKRSLLRGLILLSNRSFIID